MNLAVSSARNAAIRIGPDRVDCPVTGELAVHGRGHLTSMPGMATIILMNLIRISWTRIGLLAVGAWTSTAAAADSASWAEVKKVLKERCFACHGALKQEGNLRLDTGAAIRKGGESGPAVVPGDVQGSLLIQRITSTETQERMPPEGDPLTEKQIALITTWVKEGAKSPDDEKPEQDAREHWSFKTPVRPAVPQGLAAQWSANPIDAFIADGHRRQGLTPQQPTDHKLWLRRVSLDLTGLPPTLAEIDAFEQSAIRNPQSAMKTVVDRLLASPQYGERWGRHWMDIWRYSDWWGLGAEVRNSQKHIWHWRDWIIESLNEDKPYDHMLREMLAADELYPNDLDRLRASGYLARQYFKFNRTSWLDETIEHTAKAMLGLTFNCAKCHDHKYDPFSQADYYRFRAIFEPYQVRTDLVSGEVDFERDGIPRAFDCNLAAPTHLHVRGDDRSPDKSRELTPAVPAFLSQLPWQIEPIELPLEAHQPGLRPFVLQSHLDAAQKKIDSAKAALEAARDKATVELALAEKSLTAAESQHAAIVARGAADQARWTQTDKAADLAKAALQAERAAALATAEEAETKAELDVARAAADKKADSEKKLAAAKEAVDKARKAAEAISGEYSPLAGALKTLENNLESEASRRKPFPTTSTGRRTALARWITDARNPLTARVAVNHIWLRHLGRPLVATVFDFGRKGAPPTHPELLDWLAVEFMESGWSMNHLHRQIVLSQTYRLASTTAESPQENLARDGDNRFYWRGNPLRMEAQTIRDSLLHLAGELDLTRGGPTVPANNEASRRRSLYFFHSHNEYNGFLETFDDAAVRECYRRSESIVPQQALALENSTLAASMAEKIAKRLDLMASGSSDDDFTLLAFRTILGTNASPEELSACREALIQLRQSAPARARINLVQALLNHNDFVTVR